MTKIRDFDLWMLPCKCGYDSGRIGKKSPRKCWKCGRQLYRDFSDRALIVNRVKYEENIMIILDKSYDGESLAEVSRDVMESFSSLFNDKVKTIPSDSYGFAKGTFKVKVTWEGSNE